MDGSPSSKDGRAVVLNHNGLEDEEGHDAMDSSSEDEESPPQLVFTDGSCSDSQLSQDSAENSPYPCKRSEELRTSSSQDSISNDIGASKDCLVDVSVVEADTILQLGADVEDEHFETGVAAVEKDAVSMVEPSTSFSPRLDREEVNAVSMAEPSTSFSPGLDREEVNAVPMVKPSTSFSPGLDREEVDMDVSSGDETDVELRPSQDLQARFEEKKRIEEKIQALMKDFERKRLEEKARKANEAAAAAASLESTLSNVVSTTSEVPSATEVGLKPPEQNSIVHSSGHIVRGPSTPADSPVLTETGCDLPESSSLEQPRSEDCEKEGMGCELPSSSVEVPPVPAYEEIEECIYRVDNKKKAMSLMCFCRGNNLDCSDSRCDNRAMFTECPRNCLGKGKDCGNRRFSKREYAAVQAFYTGPNKGFGVQAVAPIKKGQFIIEYVGEVVSSEEFAKRLRRYGRDPSHTHHYMFEIGSMIIDATKKGNCSRFMNHSCEPNAVCEKWYVPRTPCAIDRIGFFAKRDIELGEEITFDYQFENYGREAQRCFCGAASCSGWIGKPPEALDDDTMDEEIESLSDESEESGDEDIKLNERVVIRRKKAHRYTSHDNVTVAEVQKRLVKALESGCRNKTHVLGWIKLMAEMSLIKNECGIVQSMCRIVEAISSVDTSLQHIFVANGLPSIFKSWLRTSNPQCLTREDLELKHCIIRSLLAMQSCAEGINARAPDLLTMVTDLVVMPTPDVLSVRDAMDYIINQLSSEDESIEINRFHESLELRFERVRNAAIRLQAVLQQHVNYRIPKKKANALPSASSGAQLLGDNDGGMDPRVGQGRTFPGQDQDRKLGSTGFMLHRLKAGVGNGRPRLRVSRWSADYRPVKRIRSASREGNEECVIRCRIGPTITQTTIEAGRPPSMKRNCPTIDDPPIIVTTVLPNWPRPTVTTNVPPPPPPHILSPAPIVVPPPPPPPAIPAVYPPAVPYYDYGPYPAMPVPNVPNYQPSYDYSRLQTDEFDSEEYRNYYQSCDVSLLQSRLQSLMKEISIVQSVLDQKTTEKSIQKEVQSPIAPPTPLPPTPKTPPPPPHKEYMWRKAVDEDGAKYYYHKETRESVWELPDGEESDPGERTPTRMPDTSGCGNDPESDNLEQSKHHDGLLSRWSAICSPQVSTSNIAQSATPVSVQANHINGVTKTNERKRDRERRVWEKFGSDADRKRAKKLMSEIEKVVGPIIVRHIGHREDATKKRKDWIIKQVSKEMLKRESERVDFNFTLTEKGAKRVTDYADAFIQRKCAKEPKDLWKGYDGSP